MQGSCALALQAALDLARTGLAVFPCGYSKRPTCGHGLLDATTDATVLRELWRRHGGELVAVRTGQASGIDVFDIDGHRDARNWWYAHRAELPVTRVHRTRSGGLHLVFRHAHGLRCSTSKLARGIDVKADGRLRDMVARGRAAGAARCPTRMLAGLAARAAQTANSTAAVTLHHSRRSPPATAAAPRGDRARGRTQ